MQSKNRFFDDMSKLAGGAMGVLHSARDEADQLVKAQLQKALSGMDLVSREEFDVVKAMAAEARAENERLARRLAELEGRSRTE